MEVAIYTLIGIIIGLVVILFKHRIRIDLLRHNFNECKSDHAKAIETIQEKETRIASLQSFANELKSNLERALAVIKEYEALHK